MRESSKVTVGPVEREEHQEECHRDVQQPRLLTIEEIKAVAGGPVINNGDA